MATIDADAELELPGFNGDGNSKMLATLASALVGRMRFAQRAGLQYGMKRDVYAAAGYPPKLEYEQFYQLYKRGDIAGRIIDMPATTTWRTPPEIIEPKAGKDGTTFTQTFSQLARRLRLWNAFERVDRLAGIGRYGVLLIGVRDGADDSQLAQPMGQLSGPQDVLYLMAYPERSAKIAAWETDPRNPRFGLPLLYDITFSQETTQSAGFPSKSARVHWSRVLHVAEDLLEDNVFGTPRLERVFNRLMDLDKVTAATGEAYWQNVIRILQSKLDPTAEISDEDLDRMGEMLEEMIHDLRRHFVGQGAELSWLSGTYPNPKEAADLFFMLIAAASGIPKRILFGTETGERASEQDERQWLGTIGDRQVMYAEPTLLRPFIDRMVEVGALPPPGEAGYLVIWPPLFKESNRTEAEANELRSRAIRNLTPIGGDPMDLVEIDEERNIWPLTSEQYEERRKQREQERLEAERKRLELREEFTAEPEPPPTSPPGRPGQVRAEPPADN